MNNPLPEALLHERDAARLLNISIHWLRRKRSKGGGPPYVKYGRAVRYEQDALLRYISEHRAGGEARNQGLSPTNRS
jgi:Helix-turn-helix domain